MQLGHSIKEASAMVGVHWRTGYEWSRGRNASVGHRATAPIKPVASTGSSQYSTVEERICIADRLREKASLRAIAAELGRAPSTISQSPTLRAFIAAGLVKKWSPEQICQARRRHFPDRPEMHVVHETVYQALYVQGRGELRRELAKALRTGRARRKPHRRPDARQARFVTDMVMISERPAEATDRAVPGHWEGDLIIGKDSASAIGTLVERSTRYVILVHLPQGRTAEAVRNALVDTVKTLPSHLAKSLTWDQGSEMASHGSFSLATNIPVYFCDPHSHWQRGTNENTNGLLRQYFPKGTDLSIHSREHLAAVAAKLNGRPRKTLDWDTPAERLAKLLSTQN
ncbi:MAG: IS30 family transposase [Longispora sp.]|nr:IS30 family transposase [Longispora sp. (in: high G+C Gram-positive bacteria)]